MPVVELLAPRPGERILDVGCGDGALTEHIVESGCTVVAIDSSANRIAAARNRGLDASRGRCRATGVRQRIRRGLQQRRAPLDAAPGCRPSRRPPRAPARRSFRRRTRRSRLRREYHGGDLQRAREARRRRRQHQPVVFPHRRRVPGAPRIERLRGRLHRALPRPTPLPGDVVGWLDTFARAFTSALPERDRPGFLEEVRELLRPTLCDGDGNWTADYTRLRFSART